ncbi:serine/threonine-protein phosphatase 2A activator isoform X1 [Phlebotomus papatasi]|uniref:serine/threonine-protein phosphatase 2A activator isoform X1 n=1 Tax=Phlebotomus papatasi TaxID=29031 RepID=UPI002483C419|nr:serine/threonine-protein phosphatase 2A activator isoform X1 [Phlebotomus papatasi]
MDNVHVITVKGMSVDEFVARHASPNPASAEVFQPPTKCVKSAMDIPAWEHSEAYHELIGFINSVSMAIQGKKISSEVPKTAGVDKVVQLFVKLNALVDDTPPVDQPQRFGNSAYRTWYQKMTDSAEEMLLGILPEDKKGALPEIRAYFVDSFGNSTRIDYGTGHELAFIFFLCCLFKVGVFERTDSAAVGLQVFDTYLTFARRLQMTYRMEPAGSHGVWSLDDYQFVPFIWGSAQLAMNSPIEPAQFLDENVIARHRNDYMFISCIEYIQKVKTGHFAEHSNQLWSISAVQSWSKINSGLVKMYQKEVLAKFPVIQHVVFGSLMSFKPVKPGTVLSSVRLGFVPPSGMSRAPMPKLDPPK